ncbi:MAG: rhomboid family intramembrane serine protease [Polyangiales bacterium]
MAAKPPSIAPPKLPLPYVTITIIALSCIAFGIDSAIDKMPATALSALGVRFIRERQWWRMVSYAFVHGGALHLGMNMFVAYQMGPPIERRLGSVRFAQASLVTCLGGAAAVLLLAPVDSHAVGASGMILGWAGMIVPLLDRKNLAQFGRFLLINALISFIPGVSWQGHLGGFLAGLACGAVLRLRPQLFSTVAPILVAATAIAGLLGAYRR